MLLCKLGVRGQQGRGIGKGLQTWPTGFCQEPHRRSRNIQEDLLSHCLHGDAEGQFYKGDPHWAEVLGALTSPVVVCLQRLTVVASYWSLLKHQFLREALLVYDPWHSWAPTQHTPASHQVLFSSEPSSLFKVILIFQFIFSIIPLSPCSYYAILLKVAFMKIELISFPQC